MFKNRNNGLTLVEILVVMAIVSSLMSFFAVSLQRARASARDAKRTGELATLRIAIEQYKIDNNIFPLSTDDFSWITSCENEIGWIQDIVSEKLVPILPLDPINSGEFCYKYVSDGEDFKLAVYMETEQYKNSYALTDGGVYDEWYEKYTPDARDWDWKTKKPKKPKKEK